MSKKEIQGFLLNARIHIYIFTLIIVLLFIHLGCDEFKILAPVENSFCRKFYICSNDSLITVNCPNGLLFNNQTKKCEYEYKVMCNNKTTTTTTTTATIVTTTTTFSINLKFYLKNVLIKIIDIINIKKIVMSYL